MAHQIKITGILEVEDDEFDPDHETGLTNAAYERYSMELSLDDLQFEQA